MVFNAWPARLGLWKSPFSDKFLDEVEAEMHDWNSRLRYGRDFVWQVRAHNIFVGSSAKLTEIRDYFIECANQIADGNLPTIHELAGQVLVRTKGQEINQHVDVEEGHLSAHLFLSGDKMDFELEGDGVARVNCLAENAMGISDPGTHAMQFRLPWESAQQVWVKPHRGLMVLFPARLPHFQRPYMGDQTFMQLSCCMRFHREEQG